MASFARACASVASVALVWAVTAARAALPSAALAAFCAAFKAATASGCFVVRPALSTVLDAKESWLNISQDLRRRHSARVLVRHPRSRSPAPPWTTLSSAQWTTLSSAPSA